MGQFSADPKSSPRLPSPNEIPRQAGKGEKASFRGSKLFPRTLSPFPGFVLPPKRTRFSIIIPIEPTLRRSQKRIALEAVSSDLRAAACWHTPQSDRGTGEVLECGAASGLNKPHLRFTPASQVPLLSHCHYYQPWGQSSADPPWPCLVHHSLLHSPSCPGLRVQASSALSRAQVTANCQSLNRAALSSNRESDLAGSAGSFHQINL